MDPMPLGFTDAQLIDIWQEALEELVEVCEPLSDDQWLLPTPCPGWSVADVAAHAIDIEAMFNGEPRPDHEPDWSLLPHAASDFGRFAEVGVDLRRGRAKDEVLAELRDTIARRRALLDALPEGAEVMGFSGRPVPLSRFLRTRTFDAWAHEQDVRTAVGLDGGWATAPAQIAFQQMASSLPFVWGKGVGATAGTSVRITVTGPGLSSDLGATVDADGKGVPAPPADDATVHVTLGWPEYLRLCTGRIHASDPDVRSRLVIEGDAALADVLLREMAITP